MDFLLALISMPDFEPLMGGVPKGFCWIPKYRFLAMSVKASSTPWPVFALHYTDKYLASYVPLIECYSINESIVNFYTCLT
jgi:hypothetical protein